jgi:hypothetical protein
MRVRNRTIGLLALAGLSVWAVRRAVARQFRAELAAARYEIDSGRLEMARWMLDHGRDDQAIGSLQTILASQHGHAQAIELLARCYERRGEPGLANYYRLRATAKPPAGTGALDR